MNGYISKKALMEYTDNQVSKSISNNDIARFPIADVVEVVRCEKCYWYKPQHFKADDGTVHPWDGLFSPGGRTDGIYVGGKCEIDKNNGYAEDKSVFRKATDFCSRGERRSE